MSAHIRKHGLDIRSQSICRHSKVELHMQMYTYMGYIGYIDMYTIISLHDQCSQPHAGTMAASTWRLFALNYRWKPQHTRTAMTERSQMTSHRRLCTKGSTGRHCLHIYVPEMSYCMRGIARSSISSHLLSPFPVSVTIYQMSHKHRRSML